MHRLPAMWLMLFLTGCASGFGAPASPTPVPVDGTLRERADELKRLRAVEGHFSGGTWNDDVDQWMGAKHALMVELGDQLGGGAHSRAQVVDLLGEPDAIATAGDALYHQIQDRGEFERPDGGGYEFLVYHWRGEHDILYLIVREEAILGAGWWYAGE